MRRMRKCPLAFMIVISAVLLSLAAVVLHFTAGLRLSVGLKHPLFASVLTWEKEDDKNSPGEKPPAANEGDGAADYNAGNGSDGAVGSNGEAGNTAQGEGANGAAGNTAQGEGANGAAGNTAQGEGANGEAGGKDSIKETQYVKKPDGGYRTEFIKKKRVKSRSPYYSDPGVVALTTGYPYTKVDESYFDDALFIGDSRVEGLKLYSGLDNATFYSKQGLTCYSVLSSKIVRMNVNGKKKTVTVEKALKEKRFARIYIMIGINELGYKTTKDFQSQYAVMLNDIKKLQPDSIIFVMGIMKVTDQYSKENDVFNNDNINDKNVAIAKLADGKSIFYLDLNPALTGSGGGLKAKYTWDGIHLKAEYYSLWVDFMKEHGIKR